MVSMLNYVGVFHAVLVQVLVIIKMEYHPGLIKKWILGFSNRYFEGCND